MTTSTHTYFPSLHTVLPATMEAGNEDTERWEWPCMPIYMEREGGSDPVYVLPTGGAEADWLNVGTLLVYYHVWWLCNHTTVHVKMTHKQKPVDLPLMREWSRLLCTGGSNPTQCTQVDKEWSGIWRDWEWDTETQPMKPLTW